MIVINHSKIKETNRKKIITLLLEKNEITKLDISRILGISVTTVSTNIAELRSEGIIEEVGTLESTGGRKAVAIRLKENCRYSIGVALTPNHIKVSFVNIKKDIIENIRIKHMNNGIENLIQILSENVELLIRKYDLSSENLLGIGISVPGIVDFEKGIIKYSYLLGAKDFKLKEEVNHFNIPIYVDNEANLSAYYEYLSRKNILKHLLYVSITEGLGLGVVIDGKIYRGDNDSSGELGHIKIAIGGKQCKCGAKGCLEAYTSMNVLIDSYNEATNSNIIEIDEFVEKYIQRDEVAQKVLDDYLKILSIGLSNLTMVFDLSCIIIGGDINNLLMDKIDCLKKDIYKENFLLDENSCNISIASFKESYLLGAAMMPIEEFLAIK